MGGIYKTVLGDTWDSIAFNTLGKEKYAKDILEANIKYLEIVIFSAGVVLTIPDIIASSDISDLPPWKQVSTSASTQS